MQIPDKPLSNYDLYEYAKKLDLNIRGVYMKDSLPDKPLKNESGIVNFNKVSESGSHWICYHKVGNTKWYFDGYGSVVLQEVRDYLGSPIYRNTEIVQPVGSVICGHLCLYVLKYLSDGYSFRYILNSLSKIGSGIQWSSPLADELHKPLRKNFPKRYVFVRHRDDIFGADLVDMQSLSKKNEGFKYILMVEDIFSKFGWAVPLKSKTGIAVRDGLKEIFKDRVCKKLWADKGSEFYNKDVKQLLKIHGVELYSTGNFEKCSVVERWNRTFKGWLWKYFTANKTHKWIDILDALLEKYNNVKNRSVGMTPTEAYKPENKAKVFRHLYKKKMSDMGAEKPKFKVGDTVRLAVAKDLFEKAYIINWTDKIYTVNQVLTTRPVTYIVVDDKGKKHKGSFYEQDLQKTSLSLFRVRKILGYKTENGKRYAHVSWMDYDSSYDSWIPVEDLE